MAGGSGSGVRWLVRVRSEVAGAGSGVRWLVVQVRNEVAGGAGSGMRWLVQGQE